MRNFQMVLFLVSVFLLGGIVDSGAQKTFRGIEYRGVIPKVLKEKFTSVELYSFDGAKLNEYVHRDKYDYNITIELGSHKWDLELFPHDIRVPGTRIKVQTEHGIEYRKRGPNSNYIGQIKGTAQKVAFNVNASFVMGYLQLDEGKYYFESASNIALGLPKDLYVLYKEEDVKTIPGVVCGAESVNKAQSEHDNKKQRKITSRGNCYEMIVAYAADWDYNQAHGGVSGAESYMTTIIGLMAANWDDEFDDEIQVLEGPSFVSDCASCDPWSHTTSAAGLLGEFASWGNSGGFSGVYATATLWVTRDISGSVVGIAYLNGLCGSAGYNVCEDFTVNKNTLRQLQCHEIGHNYGCNHTSVGIMAPTVNGSDFWAVGSVATINNNTPWPCMDECLNGSGPTADFLADVDEGCLPLTVNFSDFSQNATGWNWTFEGGEPATSTDQNPTVVYKSKGVFTVSLTVTNNFGNDTKEVFGYITVRDIPVVSFSAKTQVGSNVVKFVDQTDDPETWEWDFDDGTYSDQQNPRHVYEEDGTYEVTLTVTNACGTDSYSTFVDIVTPVSAEFNADTIRACGPLCANFAAHKTGNIDEWHWSFPGGTPSTSTDRFPRVCYEKPGNYNVFLRVSNQRFEDTLTLKRYIRVDSNSVAMYSDTVDVEDSLQLYFFDQSIYYDSITWDFGDLDVVEDSVVIRPLDNTDTVLVVLDSLGQVTVDAAHRLDSVEVHYFRDSIYKVLAITHGLCSDDTTVHYIVAGKAPTADFVMVQESCLGQQVMLADASTHNTTQWNWTISKDQQSISFDTKDVAWTPTESGVYNVRLIAMNAVGADTVEQTIDVLGTVTADFDYAAQGREVHFTSNASNADTHFWAFGDGETSTEANPIHNYTDLAAYEVMYVASNSCGNDTMRTTIDLTVLKAGFVMDVKEGCAPLSVRLTSQSTGATSLEWILDGSNVMSSTESNPSVVYENAGDYEVILVAHKGTETDTSRGVFVHVDITPEPSYTTNVKDLEVTFNNTSTGSNLDYEWSFGDGETSTEKNPVHTYATGGKYTISLKASNLCGAFTKVGEVKIHGVGTSQKAFSSQSLRLMPNPTKGAFKIAFSDMKGVHGDLTIYNLRNQKVYTSSLTIRSRYEMVEIRSVNWSPGVYVVVFSSNESTQVQKLILE